MLKEAYLKHISRVHPILKAMRYRSDDLARLICTSYIEGSNGKEYKQTIHEMSEIIDTFSKVRIHLPFAKELIARNLFGLSSSLSFLHLVDAIYKELQIEDNLEIANAIVFQKLYLEMSEVVVHFLNSHYINSGVNSYLDQIIPRVDAVVTVYLIRDDLYK